MNVLKIIERGIMRSFSLTAIYSLVTYLITCIVDPDKNALVMSQFMLLLLFGFICGFAYELMLLRKLPLVARISIHYGTLLISFFLIFMISGKIEATAPKIIVFFFIFTLVYACAMTAILLTLRFTGIYSAKYACIGKEKKETEDYTSRFS